MAYKKPLEYIRSKGQKNLFRDSWAAVEYGK